MKKVVIISLSLNLLLVTAIVLMCNNYSFTKKKFCFSGKKDIVKKEIIVKKKIKDNDSIINKTDPIYLYRSHKFSCDNDAGSSIGYSLCSMEKLQFVDSLLNGIVKNRLKEFDEYIKRNKEGVLKSKDNSYFSNCLRINIASRENFVRSQKVWTEMRTLNSEEIHLGCDGGSACGGMTNDAEIEYVLDRIKKIKVGDPCF